MLISVGESMSPPVRRVRICESLRLIPTLRSKNGRILKAYKGDSNYCYDIYRDNNGKWTGRVVSRFAANSKEFNANAKALSDGTPLVMRLRVDDMIATGGNGRRRILRVVKLSAGQITLADHNEAGNLKQRHSDGSDRFKYLFATPGRLRKLGARPLRVTVSGRVSDPGPRP